VREDVWREAIVDGGDAAVFDLDSVCDVLNVVYVICGYAAFLAYLFCVEARGMYFLKNKRMLVGVGCPLLVY